MKLVSFKRENETGLGILVDGKTLDCRETAVALDMADEAAALNSMMSCLQAGQLGIDATTRITAAVHNDPAKAVWTDAALAAPVPAPAKLLLLAGNYMDHIMEGGGKEAPDKTTMTPRFFMKPPSTTVTAPGDPILIPPNAGFIDWEAEIAVVIGREGKFIAAEDANKYVAGYTILNDVSERRLQIECERAARPGDEWFDWLNGKWLDTFAPMGPCMVTSDEMPDPHGLGLRLAVNGVVKQDSNTGNMIFSVPELIEFISRYVTLEPGDVMATGTPAGVGIARGESLKDGDVVEVEIEGIGTLTNPVKAI